ncbi:MAG: hemerythrin domain-containing protein, partial [Polyangiaceae bacterium]
HDCSYQIAGLRARMSPRMQIVRGIAVAEGPPMNAESSETVTIRDRYLGDHARLEALLEQLLAAFEANDREDVQSLWTDFESSLLAHMEAEETFLIPTLLRTREREAYSLLAEHRHIRGRVAELGAGVDLHIVRCDAARAFVEELRAHARHEDGLYQWADDRLEEHDRDSLLARIEVLRAPLRAPRPSRAS